MGSNTFFEPSRMSEFTPDAWLSRFGPRVARMIARGRAIPTKLDVSVLKRSEHSLVMRLDHSGTSMIVKAYDKDASAARHACRHEIPVLMALRGTGLAPAIRGYSIEDSFLATDFVPGQPVSELPDGEFEPTQIARKIGAWFAEFRLAVPTRTAQTNWFDYLRSYPALDFTRLTPDHKAFLRGLPITTLSIAKNDAHLSNFLVTAEDRLTGLDFEASSFKPVGWDILLTARTLALRWPEMFGQALAALIAGWPAKDPEINRADLHKLAHLFAGLTAFQAIDDNRSRTDKYLDQFNKTAPKKATRCVQVPWADDTIVPHRREDVNRFKAHLLIQARAACRSDQTEGVVPPASPVDVLAPLCATCRGKCCNEGLDKHAFLIAGDLAKLVGSGLATDPKSILDHYLKMLPDGHVKESCLFHHKNGCTIPKASRSGACNSYMCPSANEFFNRVEATETSGALLVVSVENLQPKRATISDQKELELVEVTQLSK